MDGRNCNSTFGPKKSYLLIATMFIGKEDFKDSTQIKLYLIKVNVQLFYYIMILFYMNNRVLVDA